MLRHITGFHQDDHGDWVAELDCLHNQHVRHRPPFQERLWVVSEATRAERIGAELACPRCDRAEAPEGLAVVRTLGPFDQSTMPGGLQRAHRLPARTWGCLHILEGSVDFRLDTDPPREAELHAGTTQAIPPEVSHVVRVRVPTRLLLELLSGR